MFVIITILFALLRLMPVEGYFENYDKMSSTQIQVKLQSLGLTDSLPKQLLRFYNQILHGDLGESNVYRKGVALTLPRARCCPWPPAALVASVYSPSPKWEGFTAMC